MTGVLIMCDNPLYLKPLFHEPHGGIKAGPRHFLCDEVSFFRSLLYTLTGCYIQPGVSLYHIFRHSATLCIHGTDAVLGIGVTPFRCNSVPSGRFGGIMREAIAAVVQESESVCSRDMALS